jgi:hypothetical protein
MRSLQATYRGAVDRTGVPHLRDGKVALEEIRPTDPDLQSRAARLLFHVQGSAGVGHDFVLLAMLEDIQAAS